MRLEVIDPYQGEITAQRQALGGVQAHNQRSGESGAACNGDSIQILQVEVGLLERSFDDRVDGANVLAGSNFRKDASKLGVQVHLGSHQRGKDGAPVFDHRGSGLVAGRLRCQEFGRRAGQLVVVQPWVSLEGACYVSASFHR